MDETTKLLNDLVGRLGKSMGIDDLTLDEDGFCTVAFDEDAEVTLHSNPDAGLLVLSAEVGTVAPDNERALFRAMLEANYGWGQTGGVGTLCIEPADDGAEESTGLACVMHQSPVRSHDEASFQELFDRFLEVAESWSEFLSETQAGEEAGNAGAGDAAAMPAEIDPAMRRV